MTKLKTNLKRWVSLVSIVSLFSLAAAPAFADDTTTGNGTDTATGTTTDSSGSSTTGTRTMEEGRDGGWRRPPMNRKETFQERQDLEKRGMGNKEALAGDQNGNSRFGREKMGENGMQFCTTGIDRMISMESKITEHLGNRDQKQENRTSAVDQNRQTRNGNLATIRAQEDVQRQEWYATLESKAGSDATKLAAVKEFEATMETAVKARRTAIDAAIATFRTAVDAARNGKKTDATTAIQTFKTAVDTAIATAKSSCSTTGADPAAIREKFQSDVRTAKTALQTTRKSLDTVGSQISALAHDRNTAVQAAMNTFRTTIKAAAKKLRAALGETEETTATTPESNS